MKKVKVFSSLTSRLRAPEGTGASSPAAEASPDESRSDESHPDESGSDEAGSNEAGSAGDGSLDDPADPALDVPAGPAVTEASARAVLAHELRTPLTTIIGMAEAIEDDPEVAEQFAPMIKQSGKRLHRLLNALMNLSKLQAGVQVLNYEWTDAREAVQKATDALALRAQEKGLTLRRSVHPRPVVAKIDPVALGQVVTNLLSNAIRHTAEGTVTVAFSSRERSVEIEVSDTGPGIPDAIRDSLFKPFVNHVEGGDNQSGLEPDAHGTPSTGLGLAITWHLVREMGGMIDVESTHGEGTTFRVCLPRSPHYAEVIADDDAPVAEPEPEDAVDGTIETLIDRLGALQQL